MSLEELDDRCPNCGVKLEKEAVAIDLGVCINCLNSSEDDE